MADHGDDIRIRDEPFGRGHGLRRAALIIQLYKLKPQPWQERALGVGLLDSKLGAVQHALALRGLIAGERADEAHLDDRLAAPTTDDTDRAGKED